VQARLLLLAASALAILATAGSGLASGRPARVKVGYVKALKARILVDARGRTLYMFTYDQPDRATCVGDSPAAGCQKAWPPLTTSGSPLAGKGLSAVLLGTTTRSDGLVQVTYNHHPLYHFAGYAGTPADRRPGDAHGQGFYSIWYVVSPKGNPVTRLLPPK
jgi:predicted lipoprotein with Yx(FWY)xxD motif